MSDMHERLRIARDSAGYKSRAKAARRMGIGASTYRAHENGQNEYNAEDADLYGRTFGVNAGWLLTGEGPMERFGGKDERGLPLPRLPEFEPNARMGGTFNLEGMIAVYGHAQGGPHGEFPLNGNEIGQILAPPSVQKIVGAYAVYVAGESMEDRYYAGEVVYVNPRVPVRRGDFVVAQIFKEEGEAPYAFVKRFVSQDDKVVRLQQLNPREILTFAKARLYAMHKIVMAGEG